MGTADKFLKQIFNEHLNSLHTGMPCTVIKYYPDENKADIKPIFKQKISGNTQDYSIIPKAPVLRHVGKLEASDTVFVVFAERALDFTGSRRHDLTDAVIIGVM